MPAVAGIAGVKEHQPGPIEGVLDCGERAAASVRAVVDDAGKKIGLGDFRPARKGPFGRFVVSRWEIAKEEGQLKKAA